MSQSSHTPPRVLLGISGGVAAYKAPELARLLIRRGFEVQAILTRGAQNFVAPLALESVTGQPVATDLWSGEHHQPLPTHIRHIGLARDCDLLLIAPATAHLIAELAHGLCPDLLTTTALALGDKPLVICPAMNGKMWHHPQTQQNLARLRARGAVVVEPEVGELACGEFGQGRLADLERIADLVEELLTRRDELAGFRVVVTAGGTREPIDPVRYITNHASGRLGRLLAKLAAQRGAEVVLIHTTGVSLSHPRIEEVRVETARQMKAALEGLEVWDLLFMTAAVADFAPRFSPEKIHRAGEEELVLRLRPNPDILAGLGKRKRPGQLLVGTAVTTKDPVEDGRQKLQGKNLDAILAVGVSPGQDTRGEELPFTFLVRKGDEVVQLASGRLNREEIATVMLDWAGEALARRRRSAPSPAPSDANGREKQDKGN